MWDRYGVDLFVDGKIYRISEEVAETGKSGLRRENNKIVEEEQNRN